jgi:ABC-type multidrug transport system fused ATPase/permease subunit
VVKTQEAPSVSVLREALRLSRYLGDQAWAGPTIVLLGLGAALAEALGVALAALFLFAILGDQTVAADSTSFLARAFERFGGVLEGSPAYVAAVFLGLIMINAGLIFAYNIVTALVMNRIAERFRDKVHETYVTVGYRYMQERDRGALIQTLASETWAVSDAAYALSRVGVNLAALAVFGLGLLALSWQLTLTATLCMGASFLLQRLLARPLRRYGAEMLAENRVLGERMLVSLQGMRTIRAFAQEPYVLRVYSAASARVRRLAIRRERVKSLTGPIAAVASLGTILLMVAVSGWIAIDAATVIASVMLLFRLQPHLDEFQAHRLGLASTAASLANVRETLDRADKPWPTPGHIVFPGLAREIRFEGVGFRHDPSRATGLTDVSFAIRKGEVTALAGPSGAGKTTIINLLLRLYEPDAGRINVDGTNLLDLTRDSWLGRLALAGQDVELIEGTVEQNIRLANHDATSEELRAACAAACILDDVLAIPEGFDARIGPGGGLSFSGGQRQRLGLARALVRTPDFLILDEALSALEPELEDRIWANIRALMSGKTLLVISHRTGSAQRFDAIVRIEGGRVVSKRRPSAG